MYCGEHYGFMIYHDPVRAAHHHLEHHRLDYCGEQIHVSSIVSKSEIR